MDNFMNKLSQRISAQDTIKANFMADTAEKEALKKQLAEYDAVLQSVRNLYLKQEENSEAFALLAAKLESMGGDASEKQALLKEIKDYINRSDEFTHKECVKVYRNVQALLDEQNSKFAESTGTINAQVTALNKCMNDFKVPDVTAELNEIRTLARKSAKGVLINRILLVLAILSGIGNLACVLLIHFGLL
jgi:hypothetical protein